MIHNLIIFGLVVVIIVLFYRFLGLTDRYNHAVKERERVVCKMQSDFAKKERDIERFREQIENQHEKKCQTLLEELRFDYMLKQQRLDKEYVEKEQRQEKEFAKKNEKLRKVLDSSNISSFSAEMYADIETYVFKNEAEWLTLKNRPAYSTAAEIKKKINEECKVYLQQYREMLYKYEYLLSSFPELETYVDNINDLKEITYDNLQQYGEEYDRTHNYLTKEEYDSLYESERNQRALDKYVNSDNKSDWQIGRDYELYCGYKLREANGIVSVIQHGIEKGLEDLGIDIIAEDGANVYIIQCKYWSQHKEIHEKHIAQLYGSAKMYEIKNKVSSKRVVPVFITNTELSDMANNFAKYLNVQLRCWKLEAFPRIKCNISKNGEKIYHLPFDQQYDTTKIYGNGDFYAWTVKDAENNGYRRAYRWSGIL